MLIINFGHSLTAPTWPKKRLFLLRCFPLSVSFICCLFMFLVGGPLFIQAFTHTYTVIPNVTTSHPIFQAQSSPVVILLDNFAGENYSSFIIASSINGPTSADVSSNIWIGQATHLISNSYSKDDIILPSTSYDIHFYAMPGSIFNVTFPSLSGLEGTYVLVELREFVESGLNGSVLQSQSVKPSTDSQSVIFTLEMSSFVEIYIANEGASGTFGYNITIKEITLDGARYICTVNSTTTCQDMSTYDNNYNIILAETILESAPVYPIVTLILVGKEKTGPTSINISFMLPAAVMITIGTGCLFIFVCLFLCVIIAHLKASNVTQK